MSRKNAILLYRAILIFSLIFPSVNYSQTDSIFYIKLKKKLAIRYLDCTGDSSTIPVKRLIDWAKNIHEKTESEQYTKLLKDYMETTNILDSIDPCHVFSWEISRNSFLKMHEERIKDTLAKRADFVVDSTLFFMESQNVSASKFDFPNIPFGYSKKSFKKLFLKYYSYPLSKENNNLISEHFLISRIPFLIRFYFTDENIYYKYELETYPFSGNKLNSNVRPAADQIRKNLTEQLGRDPNRLSRIGYFDIKPGDGSIYATWNDTTYSATILLQLRDNRYLARALILNSTLLK